MNKLWTKNFTIITLGTVISMFGSSISSFAIGLEVFNQTQSSFLYSVFFVLFTIPSIIVPMFVGPFLDRFSRRKTIYILDYLSFILFTLFSIIAFNNYFNYFIYCFFGIIAGIINAIYLVAYDSFYPMLISEGNYSKAYSVSSLIWPLAHTIMVPIAAIAYENVGLFPLFVVDAISFFIAATLETRIDIEESQIKRNEETRFNFKEEFKEGIEYLKEEKGLLNVTKYFMITMFVFGVVDVLLLPFFKTTPHLGATKYSIVMSSQTLGRVIGGLFHYKYIFNDKSKYKIAVSVYAIISVLDLMFFFSPYKLMIIIYLINGVLGVTSFNIRTSSTQSYVPNDKRGRFNSIFLVLTTIGQVFGQLLGGALGEVISIQYIVIIFSIVNLSAIYFIIIRNSKEVKILYNRNV